MATTAPPAETPEPAPAAARRKTIRAANPFVAGLPIALAALFMTVVGFWRTFYSILTQVDFVHQLHGWVMTAWVLLVLAQVLLIRAGKYKWHRMLGWSSVVLFVLMMLTSWQIVAIMLSGKTGLALDFAKYFAWSDVVDFPLLIVLYCGAIYYRKDRHLHSRLISMTVLAAIIPAVGRVFNLFWPGPEGLFIAMIPTYLFTLALPAAAMWADWRNGRLRWPLPFAFGWFAFAFASFWIVPKMAWFDSYARWMGSLA